MTLCIETLVSSSHELLFVFKNKFRTASGRTLVVEMTSAIAKSNAIAIAIAESLWSYEFIACLWNKFIHNGNLSIQSTFSMLSSFIVCPTTTRLSFYFSVSSVLSRHTFHHILRRRRRCFPTFPRIKLSVWPSDNLLKWWIQIYYLCFLLSAHSTVSICHGQMVKAVFIVSQFYLYSTWHLYTINEPKQTN